MKIISISFFALVVIAALIFRVYLGYEDDVGPRKTTDTFLAGNTRIDDTGHRGREPVQTSPYPDNPPAGRIAYKSESLESTRASGQAGGRVEGHVETFLTTAELNTFHGQLLDRFSSEPHSEITWALPISALGLERAQQYQLYLEPEDQIILINNIPVAELANNPAVGSILAGTAMKLSVQRGSEVFEIDLSTY